jgi:sigma-E factor negative regulatory protein RseC
LIEQQAVVTQYDDKTVWLEAERESTCSSCQMKQGCGTGLLSNHVGNRFSQIAVNKIAVNKIADVQLGQQVKLIIPEQALLQGAMLMYIFPLVLLFLFAALAKVVNLNEFMEIFAGFSGLFIGFYIVRLRMRNRKDNIQTTIVEIKEEQ